MKSKFIAAALLIGLTTFGQDQNTVGMADVMRSDGKIYVVLAVLLVIFSGIVVYLISIDRKISRLEKQKPKNRANGPWPFEPEKV